VLYALAELSKDLPEPHSADRMEAAIATEASVCVCFQGGYRGVGTMAIWPDSLESLTTVSWTARTWPRPHQRDRLRIGIP